MIFALKLDQKIDRTDTHTHLLRCITKREKREPFYYFLIPGNQIEGEVSSQNAVNQSLSNLFECSLSYIRRSQVLHH